MSELVLTLLPLAIASAIVPVQIVVTILLLRSPAGRLAATAWVLGLTATRLAQGLVFGLILGPSETASADDGSSAFASLLLLVVAVIFYVVAAKQLLRQPDEDAPPPRWMALFDGVSPGRAFLLGAVLIALSAKFWVFTLGAIAAIDEADLGLGGSTVAYLLFVVAASSIHLAILAVAFVAPARAETLLAAFSDFLERRNRAITIGLGLVFGTWFLVKALDGLGVI